MDPGTGEVLDTRSAPTGHLSLFLGELHAHLLSGRLGLWAVGIAGLVLLVIAVTGLVLWWPLGRNGVGFRVRRRSGAGFVYDLHNADIHDGSAGGPVGRMLVFVLGLLPAALLVTGWFMWRARRGHRLTRV